MAQRSSFFVKIEEVINSAILVILEEEIFQGQMEHHMYSLRRDEQSGKWYRQDIVEKEKLFVISQTQDNKLWLEM